MSVDYNVYIGPYLKVTETVIEKKVDECKDHNRPADAKFCPACGNKHRYVDELVSNAPESWEEDYPKGDFTDYLFHTSSMHDPDVIDGKRTHIYLPNRHHEETDVKLHGDYRENKDEVSLENLDVDKAKGKFATVFNDEIRYLMRCGFKVEIHYGYVSWCS